MNICMKIVLSKTSVYDLIGTTNSLRILEGWFKELSTAGPLRGSRPGIRLGDEFDAPFLEAALGVIIEADHHQMLSRVLNILYTYAHVFEGAARKLIFGGKTSPRSQLLDLLVRQHFFTLFLHWDENTRQLFHQLLLYKMVFCL